MKSAEISYDAHEPSEEIREKENFKGNDRQNDEIKMSPAKARLKVFPFQSTGSTWMRR